MESTILESIKNSFESVDISDFIVDSLQATSSLPDFVIILFFVILFIAGAGGLSVLSDGVGTFFSLLCGILLIAFIFMVVDYVIGSLAYYKALKLLKYPNPIAAWIPFWSEVAISDCFSKEAYEEASILTGLDKKVFRWHSIANLFIIYIPAVGTILSLIIATYSYSLSYMIIIKELNNEVEYSTKRKVLGILSSFFPIIFYIQVFMVDTNKYNARLAEVESSTVSLSKED